jgi:diguanylate cyclase (GGDEF)-like protein
MRIALLFGEVGFVSHQTMVRGIMNEAVNDGTDFYMFTCEGWTYKEYDSYGQGEYNIFNLPNLKQYDGVIIDVDTINNESTVQIIKKKVQEAEIPCISLNIEMEGTICLQLDNKTGVEAMLEHVATVHGAKTIHYISGPLHNRDARERREVYIDTMNRLELEWDEKSIGDGDFEYRSGREIVEGYLKENRNLPDAFLAANDNMAVGAIKALQEAGYRVPEDVIVTGYDDYQIAEYVTPRLSTVNRGEEEAGSLAYRILKQKICGMEESTQRIIHGTPVFAASCGCGCDSAGNCRQNLRSLVDNQINTDMNLELLKRVEVEFSNLNTIEDFSRSIRKYIETVGYDYFYLCFCGDGNQYYKDFKYFAEGKKPERDITAYMDTMWIPLAYEQGEWNRYSAFPTRELLPQKCKITGRNNYFIVMPIHQGDYCMGYCVIGNYKHMLAGRFIQHLVLSIDNALGSIWKQDTMKGMYERINQKWLYDELTGIYNRSGLWKFAADLQEEAVCSHRPVAVIFIDLDGLKQVNDVYGHEAGDLYIKSMADILKKCRRKGELLVRYGGDEYVIVFNQFDEDEVQEYIQTIRGEIVEYNRQSKYGLSASIGYCVGELEENAIMQIIETADQNMYVEKKQKHKRQVGQ